MVSTVLPVGDARSRAAPGQGYDGVVRVGLGDFYGSGVLLYDGRAVLSAAHLFAQGAGSITVHFETSAGLQTQAVDRAQVSLHPGYRPDTASNDLALIWLNGPAPVSAERVNLYRDSDELGQTLTLVGYGKSGTGSGGTGSASGSSTAQRLRAENQFDGDAAQLKSWLGSSMGWSPLPGTQLLADFDNGSSAQDALGRLMQQPGLGLGSNEGLIAPGDSGGPAFLHGQLAGIASYTASLSSGGIHPDIDTLNNSSYGEIGFWQRVSAYQQWIDQSLRAQHSQAPTRADQVEKRVIEGPSGSTFAYFLLEFTGQRDHAEQWLSVDYATRDGSARAGSDYLPTAGRLVLYPGENQAVIAVEVLGDTEPEADETFYLDVFNPVGGSFGPGVLVLSAMRTIVNDDGALLGP